jgi:hypothetical protein
VRKPSGSLKPRVWLWIAICSSVLLLPAWSTASTSPGPPRCTARDTRHNNIARANGYQRYCGPARAIVYLNGKTYRIRGGFCVPKRPGYPTSPRRRLGGVAIGFFTRFEEAGLGVTFWWERPSTHAEAITIDDSEIDVPGTKVAGSGTVVVGKRLNGGWFALYGRDASGPTGPLVSGSWTCRDHGTD